ncbi:unnamed protein product [Dibothriocephalus latus]|uniref:Uncharacterized protein n=1 Tax=Dibothriocephalus latus TaxID=60516 RepID=A0A3P7PCK0_DIBLA|nr:unnamed protein product [Dibothriocephalus latus]
MGEPPVPSSISLYPRLFIPIFIPVLAIVLSLLYLFIDHRYLPPAPSPEEDLTRPLIEDLEDEEVYRFAQPTVAEPEGEASRLSSTYGAI